MVRLWGVALLTVCAVALTAQGQGRGKTPFSEFDKTKPLAGECPPRLHLKDTDGKEMDLREYLGTWVVMEFGSYT